MGSGKTWQPSFKNDYALGYMANGKLYGGRKRSIARAAGYMVTIASDYAKFAIALMQQKGWHNYFVAYPKGKQRLYL